MGSVTSGQEDPAESSQRCAPGTPSPPRREHTEARAGEAPGTWDGDVLTAHGG